MTEEEKRYLTARISILCVLAVNRGYNSNEIADRASDIVTDIDTIIKSKENASHD